VWYLAATWLAYSLYPGPFSPNANWLSDLGDYSQNPRGAILYDVGVMITGILIALFALSYVAWRPALRRRGRAILAVGIASGIAAGASLALTGLFPLPTPMHGLLGMSFQINMGDLIAFTTIPLLRHPRFLRPIAVVGLASVLADLNFSVFNNTPFFEWVDIGLFLVFAALMSFNLWRATASSPARDPLPRGSSIRAEGRI
jgi:hypothetical membrane protein